MPVEKCPSVETIIVLERANSHPFMKHDRDFWWHNEMKKVEPVCPAEEMAAEDLLFILYTSGSTGKPKGMVHTIRRLHGFCELYFSNGLSIQARTIIGVQLISLGSRVTLILFMDRYQQVQLRSC